MTMGCSIRRGSDKNADAGGVTVPLMAKIRVATTIDARPKAVWAAVEDVGSHVEWMEDAVAIRFTSDRTSGVGTTFDCDTKVGPLKLTDKMEITEWEPGKAMGVRHVGLVTGEGVFTLKRARKGRTTFEWRETLTFPWWMGGPVGGLVGGRILKLIWKRNLRNLRERIEGA